ncbi:MAG: L,D-transpeptidase family protein [Chitinivibrionales bacterium]|nr:L,D-transpeptidase family protein [Chitinivibrionales bacterium]MBD3356697.1 L,D-transpeptidase family protein [Chitinivibrionales bacterium]
MTDGIRGIFGMLLILGLGTGTNHAREARIRVADRILVKKSERLLYLMSGDTLVKSYPIALGRNPLGPKVHRGDGRTPEGTYRISGRNPHSKFHLSLRVSYPNTRDRARADSLGVSPGGDIMIHGLKNGYGWIGRKHLRRDWTLGCIAVTNQEIEEIWAAVPDGTPITIQP